jgi:hypothetical protein
VPFFPHDRDRARRLRAEPSWLTQLKLGLAIAGVILWGYGARADVEWLRWVGIGFLAASVMVRLVFRRRARAEDEPHSD